MSDYTFVGDPLSESSVSINGVRLADFGVHLLADSEEPALPQTRDKTLVIPGRHGEYNFGSYFAARELNLSCGFNNQATLADAQRLIRELNTMLLDEYGRPKEVELVYDYEPDKFYKAQLSGAVPVNRISRAGTFVLPMKASDPFAYASMNEYDPKEDYFYDDNYDYDTGLYYDNPKGFDWIYERHYSGINNYSHYDTDFIIEISGTVTNPSITNLNNGEELTLPSVNNGVIVVNSKTYSIVVDGKNGFSSSNGKFFNIQSGEVGFLFAGKNPNASVTYRWLHKFM